MPGTLSPMARVVRYYATIHLSRRVIITLRERHTVIIPLHISLLLALCMYDICISSSKFHIQLATLSGNVLVAFI